ncbi:MAG: hypothetical protein ACOC2U_00555 [bacterium]
MLFLLFFIFGLVCGICAICGYVHYNDSRLIPRYIDILLFSIIGLFGIIGLFTPDWTKTTTTPIEYTHKLKTETQIIFELEDGFVYSNNNMMLLSIDSTSAQINFEKTCRYNMYGWKLSAFSPQYKLKIKKK